MEPTICSSYRAFFFKPIKLKAHCGTINCLTLKETPSVPCRKCQPTRGNERSPKLTYATKFNFSRKKLVDYFRISSQIGAPPSFFLNKMKNSSYYLKFWFIFVFFQNVDIRSRRRNLFWFYVKMHKIQDYSWWSDSKTKITNYWSFSFVKRKKSSQNFQIAKRRKGGGRPRRRPLFGIRENLTSNPPQSRTTCIWDLKPYQKDTGET